MTTEQIYEYFQDLTDGEEYLTQEAALRTLDDGQMQICNERDWWFLKRTTTLPIVDGRVDLSELSFLKITGAYFPGSSEKLVQANWDQRRGSEFDYHIDPSTNELVLHNPPANIKELDIDYKLRPTALSFEPGIGEPIIPSAYRPLIALFAVKNFKKLDETEDFYLETEVDRRNLLYQMVDDHNSREQHYG